MTCEISLHWGGRPTDIICGAPAVRYCKTMCLHEHGAEGWLCEFHVGSGEWICLVCMKIDGHTCTLGVEEK